MKLARETDTPIAASNEVAIKLIAADLIQRYFSRLKVVSTEQKQRRRDLYSTWPPLVRLCRKFHDFFLSYRKRRGRGGGRGRTRGRIVSLSDTFLGRAGVETMNRPTGVVPANLWA